jgi:hypothetical protein
MIHRILAFLIIVAMGGVVGSEQATVGDFLWLAGCWKGGERGSEFVEHWMKPAGGTMLGMGRTVKDGQTVFFEFLRIQETAGAIFYHARLPDQNETAFQLVKWDGKEAVFENPEHDFPQRVIYRFNPDGSLLARIEGKDKGAEKGIDFPMQRDRCE